MREMTVLVIDQDPDLVTRLKKRLEAIGYTVDFSRDGEEGIRKARASRPQVVILEMMLPKASGLKVARLLHYDDRYRDISLIFLSARNSKQDRWLASYAGAHEYLTKPLEFDRLKSVLKNLESTR